MLQSLLHIAFLLLTGRRRVLEIEFADHEIRIATISISFSLRNPLRPHLKTEGAGNITLTAVQNDQNIIDELKSLSAGFRIVYVSVKSSAVRSAEATVPRASSEDIPRWIADNHEKLHRLPVPLNVLSFAHEVLAEDKTGIKIRVAFLRREHLDRVKNLIDSAGMLFAGLEATEEASADSHFASRQRPDEASSIAVRGLLNRPTQSGLLTSKEREKVDSFAFRSLFHRTVLASGALLLVLLIAPYLFSFYIQSQQAEIDEQLLSIGPVYSEVKSLERQVNQLESQLSGPNVAIGRSNAAVTLHKLASSAPESLWFTAITITQGDDRSRSLLIEGYTKSGSAITRFMKSLESERVSKNVALIRSGIGSSDQRLTPIKLPTNSMVEFELRATLDD